MEGKKNIVFGFLFLVITASLGPYMIVTLLPDVEKASLEKQRVLSDLQLIVCRLFLVMSSIHRACKAHLHQKMPL